MEHNPTDFSLAGAETDSEQSERLKQLRIGDFKWVVSNKRGRRFVHELLEHAGVFRLSFTPSDPSATAFNEGARNQGLQVLAMFMKHAPEDYQSMLSENHARSDR